MDSSHGTGDPNNVDDNYKPSTVDSDDTDMDMDTDFDDMDDDAVMDHFESKMAFDKFLVNSKGSEKREEYGSFKRGGDSLIDKLTPAQKQALMNDPGKWSEEEFTLNHH